MTGPFIISEAPLLSLDPQNLPYYALQTILRMLFALFLSLIFSFVYATIAAKNKKAERILIPLLDILQSVPILGFLSITVTGFMALFPGNLLGVECASIFAIFTSQAWNMTFSLYQSFISVPKELTEVATLYRLSPWRRYWRLEVPYAMPQFLWNTMMSVSGGWFFVVASEAITVSNHTILLPGIGSYIALASQEESVTAIFYAIATMLIVIFLYDQLLFRPLLAWAYKFKAELIAQGDTHKSWVLTMIRKASLLQKFKVFWFALLGILDTVFQKLGLLSVRIKRDHGSLYRATSETTKYSFYLISIFVIIFYGLQAYFYMFSHISFEEVYHVIFLGLLTLLRVIILCAIASLIWVPIGVFIGLREKVARRVQAWVQLMAAFPANLLFPLVVLFIVRNDLNPNFWLSPLIILGSQWYILFNVIGGASGLPFDFQELSKNFHLTGWLQWKRIFLPGVFPAYVTGLITAAGGAWNASIVGEYVAWGNTTLEAKGIGSYIAAATASGDHIRILLGIIILSAYVLILNRLLWHPLYLYATTRYRLD
ncbi:MAG: ABC transporter permease subunit [Alphaproteobacteria bacterium]|nr:ABC transporter permease subunit [Alphaproteobacteria bacterium]